MAVPRKRNTARFPQPTEETLTLKEVIEEAVEVIEEEVQEPEPVSETVSEPEPVVVIAPPVSAPRHAPIMSMVPVDMPQAKPTPEEKNTAQPPAPVVKTEPRRRNIPRFTK